MTSIATVQRFLGQTVIDALVHAGINSGTPPAVPILYHGKEPDDCCPPVGSPPRVIVWWDSMGAPEAKGPCDGPVAVTIGIRLLCCWPAPERGQVVDPITEFGPTAEYLGRAAWIGYTALMEKLGVCEGKPALRKLISDTLGISSSSIQPAVPRLPKGTCAGVDWKVTVTPHGADVATWMEPPPEPEPEP